MRNRVPTLAIAAAFPRMKRSGPLLAYLAVVLLASAALGAKAIPDRPSGDKQPVALTKPRVAPLPEGQWTTVHKQLVAKFSRDGRADNQLKTLLNVPEIVEGAMPFTVYLSEESTLSPRQREILILRTAWLCGARSLWASHAALARRLGMTADEIRRIAQGPDGRGWDPFERTLLQMADQLYRNSSVDDATWKSLSAKFDLEHLMDAVETVNHFTFLSLLFNSFGVQPDEGLMDRLPTDVPYRVTVAQPEPPLTIARVEAPPGAGIAVGRTFARYPKLNQPRGRRANYINAVSPLSPRHREMLILRSGWNCRSEYEWAKHVGSVGHARDRGVDPLHVAMGPDAPGTDPFDAALLRAADELYQNAMVADTTWNALAARFDTRSLMSAVYTASSYRATSMALRTYGVQLEPNDENFPQVDSH
jgi:4-carboxymuconolactone decarboxylase